MQPTSDCILQTADYSLLGHCRGVPIEPERQPQQYPCAIVVALRGPAGLLERQQIEQFLAWVIQVLMFERPQPLALEPLLHRRAKALLAARANRCGPIGFEGAMQ